MALPTGLVPVTVFALTVGVSTAVALGAHLFHRAGSDSFGGALRAALAGASGLYLVGVLVVWGLAGGPALWEVAATLLAAGVGNLLVLTALPLFVGRRVVRHVGGADSDTALRYATYGWPVAMVVVFAIFVAPGGLADNAFFALGGPPLCLVGFCGIGLWFAVAVLFELVVALLGPGIVGVALYASTARRSGSTASP